MATAGLYAKIDQLEKVVQSLGGNTLVSSDNNSVLPDMSKYDENLSKVNVLEGKVSDLVSKQLPVDLLSRVVELEANVAKLPDFYQKLQNVESKVVMLLEHIKSIDLVDIKNRVDALENK